MKIHPVTRASKRSNRYCGPAVLSSITGRDTLETAAVIRLVTGKTSVMGTTTGEIRAAFGAYGISMSCARHTINSRPTLARWLKESKDIRKAGVVFLVVAGHHWQLISGRRYVCGQTIEIVSIRDKRVKRRARVTEVYQLHGKPKLDPVIRKKLDQKEREKKRRSPLYAKAAKLRKIARELDVDIEVEYLDYGSARSWWVYPGKSWDTDPRDGEHHRAIDVDELVMMLEEYIEAAPTHRAV